MKGRAYGSQGEAAADSARVTLRLALDTLLRLFAPILPFVTEEVWSWWRDASIHRASWPEATAVEGEPLLLDVAASVLGEVRKAKTAAKASMRADVARTVVRDSHDRLAALSQVEADVCEAGRIADLTTEEADSFSVEVTLA